METDQPLISVIIPTFNRSDLIIRAIRSVMGQTYSNTEIIIIDDCSTDNTAKVVNDFIHEVGQMVKISYFRNETNLDNAATRNVGLKHAQGEYIAFLDDDDVWFPDKLEQQIKLMMKTGKMACFCGQVWIEGSKVLKSNITKNENISFENGGPTSTWLIHRSVFDKIGNFDENQPSAVDGEFLVRLNKEFEVVFVEDILYVHYYYQGQISSSNRKKIDGFEKMLEKHHQNFNKYELSSLYQKLTIFYLLDGQKQFKYVLNSIKAKPGSINTVLLGILMIPSRTLSRVLLNKILDLKGYPKTFAGRGK